MNIDEILKQATAYKKSDGYSYAINFLINNYDENNPDDLPRLLDKIFTYFSKDTNNDQVRKFITRLISSKNVERYSGLFSTYYWLLQDYESYRQTLMNQISKVNPYHPWEYCFQLKELQSSLCNYYKKMGLTKQENAIEYLYNLISSYFFDIGAELMMYDYNFTRFSFHLRNGSEVKFYHPDRLIPLSESIENCFTDDANDECICLKTLNCPLSNQSVIKLIKQKLFTDFPKKLGFNIDILNKAYNNTSTFALSFFSREYYNDTLLLNDKISEWRIQIAGKTADIANDETNNILRQFYSK